MPEKYIEYNGVLFCRDEKTGYYLNSTTHKRLHRYVWETEVGEIPEGFHIHHIDRNPENNSINNLCMLNEEAHKAIHAEMEISERGKEAKRRNLVEKAVPKASEWHKSEAGREWHSKKSLKMYEDMNPVEFVCAHCGKTFSALPVGVHKYCSNACRSAARRARGDDNETRVCPICGNSFSVNKYSETRFCSRRCMGINRTMINEQKKKDGIPIRAKRKK